jgi:hypothetical protein
MRAQIKQRRVPAYASLDRVMEDVRFSLKRIYPERQLEFDIAEGGPPPARRTISAR